MTVTKEQVVSNWQHVSRKTHVPPMNIHIKKGAASSSDMSALVNDCIPHEITILTLHCALLLLFLLYEYVTISRCVPKHSDADQSLPTV